MKVPLKKFSSWLEAERMCSDLAKCMMGIWYHLKLKGLIWGWGALCCKRFSAKPVLKCLLKYLHLASRGHFTSLCIAQGANADEAETQCSSQIRQSHKNIENMDCPSGLPLESQEYVWSQRGRGIHAVCQLVSYIHFLQGAQDSGLHDIWLSFYLSNSNLLF